MIDKILFFIHYALLLLFGLALSVAFVGIRYSRKNIIAFIGLFAVCACLQLVVFFTAGESLVWKLYPLISHLPTGLFLCLGYRKRIIPAIAAITTAYLCCQPAKWLGLLTVSLSENSTLELLVRILALLVVGVVFARCFAGYLSEIYSKRNRSILIFGIVPFAYYLFDYFTGIYTDLWITHSRTVSEFLPFFLCIMYLVFCVVYYQEHEKKKDAERKESIIRISVEQQAKEIDMIKRSEQEIRILRHDMRHHLNNLALCLENDDCENAKKILSGLISSVDSTTVHRYCDNAIVNHIISSFAARCAEAEIDFSPVVSLGELMVDEIIFSSILSNALDNAVNAQESLPKAKRNIRLVLKTSENRLLLSVTNSIDKKPFFADGMPVSTQPGHGYGTQSIRHMTERLGGNCLFAVENNQFVVRVVISI